MKKIISLFLVSCSLFTSTAANDTPDWESMILVADYDSTSEELVLDFAVKNASYINTDYYLNLFLGGEKYRKSFSYSDLSESLEVEFRISDNSEATEYPISVTIQNGRLSEVFSSDAVVVFEAGATTSKNTPSSFNTSGLTNTDLLDLYYRNSAIPTNNSVWFLPQHNSNKLPVVNTTKPTISTPPSAVPEVITPITVVPSTMNTIKFTPKYTTKQSEPSIINGIGNPTSPSSWRVD